MFTSAVCVCNITGKKLKKAGAERGGGGGGGGDLLSQIKAGKKLKSVANSANASPVASQAASGAPMDMFAEVRPIFRSEFNCLQWVCILSLCFAQFR